ncbi:hypothetical protein GQ53DRAFT_841627 [Thozetella sp. PMI_491]|nr:hypothetical protein GQ53DRAFT_841627 [Thozetella sp. PMI_491]
MNVRLAACDPCRRAKLACDHSRPICSRCRARDKAVACVYRTRPFKRRKHPSTAVEERPAVNVSKGQVAQSSLSASPSTPLEPSLGLAAPSQRYRYPNPGFLGSSSHEAIFNHFPPSRGNEEAQQAATAQPISAAGFRHDDDMLALRGARLLKSVHETASFTDLRDLILLWTYRGTNFSLAGPLLSSCIESVGQILSSISGEEDWSLSLSRRLLINTSVPFSFTASSCFSDFLDQFTGDSIRWETLGLVLAAVAQATIVVPYSAPLYATEEKRQHLQKLMTGFSDQCLELSLALDCLNDLQLIFHYENCIVHSFVNGDQSFHTWMKLGDIASSLFAIGYHEKIEIGPRTPLFLADLRRNAFARIYSADKNMSLFLGRPCRINRRFCHFQIPSNNPKGLTAESESASPEQGNVWAAEEEINFLADTKWTAICAILKEEILELFRDTDRDRKLRLAMEIQQRAEVNWSYLPPHFRLEKNWKSQGKTPFERDFLVHTRLNHLQIIFLLRLMLVGRLSEPDASLLAVAQEIVSLVVETVVLRDYIVNSGTGLIWKVAHYGLPAAGIISLALLNNTIGRAEDGLSRPKMLRDLNVLVAEVQMGGIVLRGDPNYALLSSATLTIQNVLGVVADQSRTESNLSQHMVGTSSDAGWDPWMNGEIWEFEQDFWRNLADHPSLVGLEQEPIPR